MQTLDLRLPLGLLFLALGLIMVVFGLLSDPALYARSLGININVEWGTVLVIFGALMTVFGARGSHRAS
jgi:hypothetical protein